jgi:dihydropteroate synthase
MDQRAPTTSSATAPASHPHDLRALDEHLSQRPIDLDPAGYVLICLDRERGELVAELYSNGINARGLATDPDTGEVLSCRGSAPRRPVTVFRGRTAKQLGIQLTEGGTPSPISRLDHALYLGRELQKAEAALRSGGSYIQD